MAKTLHLIIALGSRGDIQPYLAVGQALAARGAPVAIATHVCFRSMVEDCGLEFRNVAGDPRDVIASEAGQAWIASGEKPIQSYKALRRLIASVIQETWSDCRSAAEDAKIIITSRLAVAPAYIMAEHFGVKFLPAYLQPSVVTSEFPAFYSPSFRNISRSYNFISHVLVEQVYWAMFRKALAEMPTQVAVPRSQRLVPSALTCGPSLLGVSRAVIPQTTYRRGRARVTGYWFGQPEADWRPPDPLMQFLKAGDPPVCIGFGSMLGARSAEVGRLAVEAVRGLGRRAILLRGWGGLGETTIDDGVFVLDQAPHAWLFPRVAAVVHHGGAGTTAAALRAGRPSIITPFFADQAFWSRRLHQLGLGPELSPQATVGFAELAEALRQVLDDGEYDGPLKRVQSEIAAEDGPGEAAETVFATAEQAAPRPCRNLARSNDGDAGVGQLQV
jgi:UDP:flavonoid glycosyltransferase YjiC (YdhE family)